MGSKRRELPAQVTIIAGLWVHCQSWWQLKAQQLGQMASLQPVMGSRPTQISSSLWKETEKGKTHTVLNQSALKGGRTISIKGSFVCLLLISICSFFFKAMMLFIYCDFKHVWGRTFNLEDIACRIFVPCELTTQCLTTESFYSNGQYFNQPRLLFICPQL